LAFFPRLRFGLLNIPQQMNLRMWLSAVSYRLSAKPGRLISGAAIDNVHWTRILENA
jgi:hypothetical protein